jgi:2-polyprenyl-3-methyl-5-hydroxy-6-metoxy-1,4-benzoquinol methylase
MMTEIPAEVAAIDYVGRWREIVERRRVQMESAYAASGIVNADYWGKRAKTYREALHHRPEEDPFFLRVREACSGADGTTDFTDFTDGKGRDEGPGRGSGAPSPGGTAEGIAKKTVLDVGAGTGRHTLALAPNVARVTAVDPSGAMLGFLREDVAAAGLTNVEAVESDWMTAEVEAADVVICSHVLYPIAEPLPFVERLASHARERVFVYLRVDPLPTDMGLWSEFYGVPLQSQPVALDLVNLLAQAGIMANMEVTPHRFTWTFHSLEESVEQLRNTLCLREDDAAGTEKLRGLLRERLVEWPNGRLGPEVGAARSAIISWASEQV